MDAPAEASENDVASANSTASTLLDDRESPFDYDSPLANYLGLNTGSSTEAHIEQEEAVVRCMKEQGFEYTPTPFPAEAYGLPSDPDGAVFGTDQWFDEYGFGISTEVFSQRQVGVDLVGSDTPRQEGTDDPNVLYRDSLSVPEANAYDQALYGQPHDLSGEDVTDSASDEKPGCYEQALIELAGGLDLGSFHDIFGAEIVAVEDSIWFHPRVEEARDEAAECLSELGLEITRFDEVQRYFDSRLSEVIEVAGLNDSSPDLEPGQEPELSDEAKAILSEIQDEERLLAKAFRECGAPMEMYSGYGDPLIMEVRIELEEQFLADNEDRIEAFLLSME